MDRHTASCLVLRQCWLHLQDSSKEWILALYNINAIELSDSQKANTMTNITWKVHLSLLQDLYLLVELAFLVSPSYHLSDLKKKKTWATMKNLHPNITSSRNFGTWIIFQWLSSMISFAYFNMSHSLKAGAKCGLLKDQSHQSRWKKSI